MNPPVTVALVGIAGYGDSYLGSLLDHAIDGHYQIVGLVDPAPERSRRIGQVRDRGIRVHTDLAGLYASATPDLLMMATPIQLHAPHTIAALAAGSNVLCEKPLAATVADGLRMRAAERQTGRFAAIGFQWSFSRAIQGLKRDILSGALGRPLRLRSIVLFPRGDGYYRRNAWAGRLATDAGDAVFDGPANNAAAHYLHNMLYVLGPTRSLSATPLEVQAELCRANAIETHDTAVLRVRTACGAELMLATSHTTPMRDGPRFRFEFEHAVVTYGEEAPHDEVIARFHDGRVVRYGSPERDRPEKLWQSIAAARDGTDVACGVRAALPHIVCVDAAHQSMPEPTVVPAAHLRRAKLDTGEMTVVHGLDTVLRRCYDTGEMPSETGLAPWSAAGKALRLRQVPDPTPATVPAPPADAIHAIA